MSLTAFQILELAPDLNSRKAGQDLSKPQKWLSLGSKGGLSWGEIKGSGAAPYRTAADISGAVPAYKCSCPSQKFPCKHGLGIMLIGASSPQLLTDAPTPDWVAAWTAGRTARAAADGPDKPVDEAAQAKRRSVREGKVDAGIADLRLWLGDLARRGIASARTEPYAFWDRMAARLVDAQAPGLARRVRELGSLAARPGTDAMEAIGRLELLVRAWSKLGSLDAGLTAEVPAAIGFPVGGEDLSACPAVHDTWTVLAHVVSETGDKLRTWVVWLHGRGTRRFAAFVDHAAGDRAWPIAPAPGQAFAGSLAFYPGAAAFRAALVGATAPGTASPMPHVTVTEALDAAADLIVKVPWTDNAPIGVGNVRFGRLGGDAATIGVGDEGGALLLVDSPANAAFVSAAGGASVGIFGTWDGCRLTALAMCGGGRRYAAVASPDDGVPVRRVA